MELRWLPREEYKGFALHVSYTTQRVYDVVCQENGFFLRSRDLPAPEERGFADTLFGDWLEDPVALGAFDGETLLGLAEGSVESWNGLFRLSNILVFPEYRGRGVGAQLLEAMVRRAQSLENCRGVILETQSCNAPAIEFYKKHGFVLCRIDLYAYSNADVENGEVRVDMLRILTERGS